MLVIIGGFVYWLGCSLPFIFYLFIFNLKIKKNFPLFSLFVSVYMYVSLCDFVCLGLLLPFVLGFCLFILFFLFLLDFVVVLVCLFLFMSVCVYVSSCDFVCLALLLPLGLGFYLFFIFFFLFF